MPSETAVESPTNNTIPLSDRYQVQEKEEAVDVHIPIRRKLDDGTEQSSVVTSRLVLRGLTLRQKLFYLAQFFCANTLKPVFWERYESLKKDGKDVSELLFTTLDVADFIALKPPRTRTVKPLDEQASDAVALLAKTDPAKAIELVERLLASLRK